MKHVAKATEPDFLTNWKAQSNEDWQACYAELRVPEKPQLHQALTQEQGHVCCYCGRRIDIKDSHIEHFRPQSTYPELDIDYFNLLVSCTRETSKETPKHCGVAKENWFEENNHISPLEEGCEDLFNYGADGSIYAVHNSKEPRAEKMIEVLQLNCNFLKNRREQAIRIYTDPDCEEYIEVTDAEVIKLKSPNKNGMLPSFGHVIVRFL